MNIYSVFNKLVEQNRHIDIIAILQDFLESKDLSIDEKGWAYWNISDRYALMREPQLEYKYHVEFVEWGKEFLKPDKLHWFVSDATQALTLSLGNFFDQWYDWYLYACKNSSKNEANRGVRFESHKQAAGSLLKLNKIEVIEEAFNNMFETLQEDQEWENHIYCSLTFHTLHLEKAYKLNQQEMIDNSLHYINQILDTLLRYWKNLADHDKRGILGSWSDLNAIRASKRSILTLLHNLGCTLNRIKKYSESVYVFNHALAKGHKLNNYGLALYLSSLWKSEMNKEKIKEQYSRLQSSPLSLSQLLDIAPELVEVFSD